MQQKSVHGRGRSAGVATPIRSGKAVTRAPLIVAAAGSASVEWAGYGWLTWSGESRHQGFSHRKSQIGREIALVAELCAIADVVRRIPGRRLIILCRNQRAVEMARRWLRGESLLPNGYAVQEADSEPVDLVAAQRLLFAQAERIAAVHWVGVRERLPLSQGAHKLAVQARQHASGRSRLPKGEVLRQATRTAEDYSRRFRMESRLRCQGGRKGEVKDPTLSVGAMINTCG